MNALTVNAVILRLAALKPLVSLATVLLALALLNALASVLNVLLPPLSLLMVLLALMATAHPVFALRVLLPRTLLPRNQMLILLLMMAKMLTGMLSIIRSNAHKVAAATWKPVLLKFLALLALLPSMNVMNL